MYKFIKNVTSRFFQIGLSIRSLEDNLKKLIEKGILNKEEIGRAHV